jgi:hypothetical protein
MRSFKFACVRIRPPIRRVYRQSLAKRIFIMPVSAECRVGFLFSRIAFSLPRMGRAPAMILALMSTCCTSLVCHAGAESPVDALRACASENDDARRLRCYDQAMSRPLPQPAASTALASSPSQSFGASQTQTAKKARASEPLQMTAKVLRVVELPNNRRIVKLDNDQIWTEQDSDEFFSIKAGDTVTVTQGALGSFWLSGSSAGKATIRVRRTQ